MSANKKLDGAAIAVVLIATLCCNSQARAQSERQVFVMEVDGDNLMRLVTSAGPKLTNCGSSSWSLDGTRIVFDATPGSNWKRSHIFVYHLSGDKAGELTDLGLGVTPLFSPDGSQVVFHNHEKIPPDVMPGIWVMDADGANRRRVVGGGRGLMVEDGRIVCTDKVLSPTAVFAINLDGKKRKKVELFDVELIQKINPTEIHWMAAKQTIAVVGTVERQHVFSTVRMLEKRVVQETVYRATGNRLGNPQISPNGKMICGYLFDNGYRFATIDLTADDPQPQIVPIKFQTYIDFGWAPNSRHIVLTNIGIDAPDITTKQREQLYLAAKPPVAVAP